MSNRGNFERESNKNIKVIVNQERRIVIKIVKAERNDIPELYKLQLIAFESGAEIIGSRDISALLETEEDNEENFANWKTLEDKR